MYNCAVCAVDWDSITSSVELCFDEISFLNPKVRQRNGLKIIQWSYSKECDWEDHDYDDYCDGDDNAAAAAADDDDDDDDHVHDHDHDDDDDDDGCGVGGGGGCDVWYATNAISEGNERYNKGCDVWYATNTISRKWSP